MDTVGSTARLRGVRRRRLTVPAAWWLLLLPPWIGLKEKGWPGAVHLPAGCNQPALGKFLGCPLPDPFPFLVPVLRSKVSSLISLGTWERGHRSEGHSLSGEVKKLSQGHSASCAEWGPERHPPWSSRGDGGPASETCAAAKCSPRRRCAACQALGDRAHRSQVWSRRTAGLGGLEAVVWALPARPPLPPPQVTVS